MGKAVGRTGSKNQNNISSRLGMIIVISCLALLAVVVMYKARDLKSQSSSLQVQAAELQSQLEDAQAEYEELQEKEEYMKTDEYVEETARNQLGLVYPDEIVIKPEE